MVLILDGGMGRQLQRIGAPFGQPEWSSLSLIEKPSCVIQAHIDFINAGADIITTNSYAIVPFHLGKERFNSIGPELLDRSVDVAFKAKKISQKPVQIAGCVPPVFGSYRPKKFDPIKALDILHLFRSKLTLRCDIIIAETLSSITEVETILKVFQNCRKSLWISVTLNENNTNNEIKLRSGEPLAKLFEVLKTYKFNALLFNCNQPESMSSAIKAAYSSLKSRCQIGVYANAFPKITTENDNANRIINKIRSDLTPRKYKSFATEWVKDGANIVGGCCGIGPEHIAELKYLKRQIL